MILVNDQTHSKLNELGQKKHTDSSIKIIQIPKNLKLLSQKPEKNKLEVLSNRTINIISLQNITINTQNVNKYINKISFS